MPAQTKFTHFHLTILLAAYKGNHEGYPKSDVSLDCAQDLIRQGLVYRLDSEDCLQVTAYGEAKIQELLLRLQTPKQFYTENPNG